MATWKDPKRTHTAADQVTPDIFNTLAENEVYLNEVKIETHQVQDGAVTSTQASTRANLASGDTVKVAFGKLRKWYADFGTLAFLNQVDTDQIAASAVTMGKIASHAVSTGKIDGLAVTTAKIADGAVTDAKVSDVAASKITGLAKVATSGSYNDLTDKPTIATPHLYRHKFYKKAHVMPQNGASIYTYDFEWIDEFEDVTQGKTGTVNIEIIGIKTKITQAVGGYNYAWGTCVLHIWSRNYAPYITEDAESSVIHTNLTDWEYYTTQIF